MSQEGGEEQLPRVVKIWSSGQHGDSVPKPCLSPSPNPCGLSIQQVEVHRELGLKVAERGRPHSRGASWGHSLNLTEAQCTYQKNGNNQSPVMGNL